MNPQSPPDRFDLRARTKAFAVRVLKLCGGLNRGYEAQYVRRQLTRAGASVAANYRAACRARSRREFVAKISIVVEECDEAGFWLELGTDLGFFKEQTIQDVKNESNELTAIFVASRCTARRRLAEAKALRLAQNHSQNPKVPESQISSQ